MAFSRVFSFDDPSACQLIFPSADVELFPTTKGNFHADVTQVGMNGIWMHRIHVSLPEINTVAVKPGRRSFGFLTECNSSPLLDCGQDVLYGDIVVNRSDVVHQRSDADFHYGTVSLPSEGLAATAEAIVGRGLRETLHKSTIRPPSELMCRLLNMHKSIGQLAHDTPDILALPEVSRALENELVRILVRCLAEGHSVESTAGGRRHDTILTRFEEFLEANPDRPLYLTEICAAIGANASRLLRRASWHGANPLSHLAPNAPRAAGAPAFGSVQDNRHTDCHRPWILGAWAFLGCLSRAVWRIAVGNIAAAYLSGSKTAHSSLVTGCLGIKALSDETLPVCLKSRQKPAANDRYQDPARYRTRAARTI
jgi:hypothetical protein